MGVGCKITRHVTRLIFFFLVRLSTLRNANELVELRVFEDLFRGDWHLNIEGVTADSAFINSAVGLWDTAQPLPRHLRIPNPEDGTPVRWHLSYPEVLRVCPDWWRLGWAQVPLFHDPPCFPRYLKEISPARLPSWY